jgi:hypothetical protein
MKFLAGKSIKLIFLLSILLNNSGFGRETEKLRIKYIDFYYENASTLLWEIKNDTLLKISLLPDYQSTTLNRQTDHWNLRIVAEPGTRVRLTIEKMLPDVYNGRPATDWWNYPKGIPCYLSYDYSEWTPIETKTLQGRELYLDFTMKGPEVYLARLPVYSIASLNSMLAAIKGNKGIEILNAGKTFEGRNIEFIRSGNKDAKFNIVIRARAHPWEPGGSWVMEGFIDELIKAREKNLLKDFCFYLIPMAGKDGVARGMTRFTPSGMDLNRGWDKDYDKRMCPENFALDSLFKDLIAKGHKPDLVIDLHNDDKGDIHLAVRDKSDKKFIDDMQRLEKLMREKGLFSEDFRYQWKEANQPVVTTIENGMLLKYGIEAFTYELNANWLKGQGMMPSSVEWKKMGAGLLNALREYYSNK